MTQGANAETEAVVAKPQPEQNNNTNNNKNKPKNKQNKNEKVQPQQQQAKKNKQQQQSKPQEKSSAKSGVKGDDSKSEATNAPIVNGTETEAKGEQVAPSSAEVAAGGDVDASKTSDSTDKNHEAAGEQQQQHRSEDRVYIRYLMSLYRRKGARCADVDVSPASPAGDGTGTLTSQTGSVLNKQEDKKSSIASRAIKASKRATKAAEKAVKLAHVAHEAAQEAAQAAEEIRQAADDSRIAAEEAARAAEEAKQAADNAIQAAESAKLASEDAQKAFKSAKKSADDAKQASEEAKKADDCGNVITQKEKDAKATVVGGDEKKPIAEQVAAS